MASDLIVSGSGVMTSRIVAILIPLRETRANDTVACCAGARQRTPSGSICSSPGGGTNW